MTRPITPGELPKWVPGQLLATSEGLGWSGVGLRAYRYEALDVAVPALADFMIVSYKRGSTQMARRFEGRWTRARCDVGDISLLTRVQDSHWHWTDEIDVAHAYLSDALVSRIATDVLERSIADVRLHDLLQARDAVVSGIVDDIVRESGRHAIGGSLYVEALSTQLVVHLLRNYASVTFREPAQQGGLPQAMCARLTEYIETRLHEALTLEELAGVAAMGAWTFGRRFRQSFGMAPHAYVVDQRVERARRLLTQGKLPIKAVASACGFSDQAHMTRVLGSRLGSTPAALRRNPAS
ncbi:helix-turn-helix domain-containing protein [Derxia lacustris]|uniref:helix-turn-helix domain-containing protein n=1 Tax=Derxia lacustris TaxID=764842 RepID=UPI000A16D6AD|nr:AraC family transcriptional regulator [Derxia lacustris]